MASRLPALLVLFLLAFSSLTHVVTQEQKMLENSDDIYASSGTGTRTKRSEEIPQVELP